MKKGKRNKIFRSLLLLGAIFFSFFSSFFPFLQGMEVFSLENPYAWQKISSYTTYFNKNDAGRCENIAIAGALIDGVTLQAYGEFSFNQTVGKRTQEAGFQQAKIILNGEYVLGVGGGVCQVSTTLYNSALKAGLEVVEFHPHSLKVGYVEPSRDAMVSTHADLKLFNPYPYSVYLSVLVFDGEIKISFYGEKIGDRYEIISKTVEEIAPPLPIVKEGGKEGILRQEQKGIRSELYVERYRGKVLLARKRVRKDFYYPVQGIIAKKVENTTNNIPSNACVF